MGTKVVKPVFLKNIQIEGKKKNVEIRPLKNNVKLYDISHQEWRTRPSASPARLGPSATPPVPRRVKPAPGTPSLATAPARARPVTPAASMLVGAEALFMLSWRCETLDSLDGSQAMKKRKKANFSKKWFEKIV